MWGLLGFLRSRDPMIVRLESPRENEEKKKEKKKKKKKKKKIAADVDLSWVGHVVNLPDGHVQVKWGDGSMSTVRTCIFFSLPFHGPAT
jgi:hypothetical protein